MIYQDNWFKYLKYLGTLLALIYWNTKPHTFKNISERSNVKSFSVQPQTQNRTFLSKKKKNNNKIRKECSRHAAFSEHAFWKYVIFGSILEYCMWWFFFLTSLFSVVTCQAFALHSKDFFVINNSRGKTTSQTPNYTA